MWFDLNCRRPALEEMDRPDIDPAALEGALRALVRINTVGNGAGLFWPTLSDMLRESGTDRPFKLLDIGCGAGDMSRRLEQRARRAGYHLQADGCDINPHAIALAAKDGEAAGHSGRFFVCDAIQDELPDDYDVIISSLCLHHLSDGEAVEMLRRAAARTRRLLLVSDLIRSRFGLLLVYLATYSLTRSHVVHRDGVTSLRAAFSIPEARQLAESAGLRGARIVRRWPERFLLAWRPEIVPKSP